MCNKANSSSRAVEVDSMSSQECEQVLMLLRELATLKGLDNASAAEMTQQRRGEITTQIKAIAERKKNGQAEASALNSE
jgi:Tfp pilus assembly protein PilN